MQQLPPLIDDDPDDDVPNLEDERSYSTSLSGARVSREERTPPRRTFLSPYIPPIPVGRPSQVVRPYQDEDIDISDIDLSDDEEDEKYPVSDLSLQLERASLESTSYRSPNPLPASYKPLLAVEKLLGLSITVDKNKVFYIDKTNMKVYYFLDCNTSHAPNVYKTVLDVWSKVSPYKSLNLVPADKASAYCNNDGITANFVLNILPSLAKGFNQDVYLEDNEYDDKYYKTKLLTNKYFVPKNGGFVTKTFFGLTFDALSNTANANAETCRITISAYLPFYFLVPESPVRIGESFDFYKLIYSTTSPYFSNSFSFQNQLRFRTTVFTNNPSNKPNIFVWDENANAVVKVELPIFIKLHPTRGTKQYTITQTDFNATSKLYLLIYWCTRNVTASSIPSFVHSALAEGLHSTLSKLYDIVISQRSYLRTVPGINRGTMFPFQQMKLGEPHPPRIDVSVDLEKELNQLGFSQLIERMKKFFVSTNILQSEVGKDLSKSELEQKARPILIKRFIEAMRERKKYTNSFLTTTEYKSNFGFNPNIGQVFTGKDIQQSFQAKHMYQSHDDHVIGEYDLDLTWKPYDYKWNPYIKSELWCKPNKLTLETIDWKKLDPNYVEDTISFDSVFEYAAQAKANTIIAKYYNKTPEWVERTVLEKRDFPTLSQDQAKSLYEELSETKVELFDVREMRDVSFDCNTDYVVVGTSHPGYDVKYGPNDLQPLCPSNLYFFEHKGKIRTYFISSCLERWEKGFASFDYIAYKVMPLYPKEFVTEQFVHPEVLCQILEVSQSRGLLKDYPILDQIIKPNIEIMQQLYWWNAEYEASDAYYQKLSTDDMAIWHKRDIMGIYYLTQISEKAGLKEVGFRKYTFTESAKQNPAVFLGCLLKELILTEFTLQMELPERTVRWVPGVKNNVEANRSQCEKEEHADKNPCNPCFNNKVSLNPGSHEWFKF